LNNNELIEHTSQNIKKYLKDKRSLFETEKLLINFFNKISKLRESNDLQYEYSKMKYEIMRLRDKSSEKDVIEELNIIEWIDRKIAVNTRPYS
jgi:hypothetical protein